MPYRTNTKLASKVLILAAAAWMLPQILSYAVDEPCDCPPQDQHSYLLAYNDSQARQQAAASKSRGASSVPKYLDASLSVEERIDDLMPRMTLDEKITQVIDSWGTPGIARLKVPPLFKTEGLHGQSYSLGATVFPHPIAMATTFNPELIDRVGRITAVESRAAGIRASWSPVLDVARDARWGRVEETYGEDPYLVSRMGVAWINGFQSQNMIAIPKHFAGHGEPLGGRDSHDVGLSERKMREIHLPPFRAAIKEAHAGGVMAAYSTWDGTPANASVELLQKILRQEWDFDGVVVSDCGGPEHFLNKQALVKNLEEACRLAILAGVDIECGSAYKKALAATLQNGLLSESDLDACVRDVLRAKFRLGLFDTEAPQKMLWDPLPAYSVPEHRTLAYEVAVEGMVLLKNDHQLLPLSKNLKTIAVIGPNADQAQTGDYSPKLLTNQMVTVLQGIKARAGSDTEVLYARGCDAVLPDTNGFAEAIEIARRADVVVMVVGDHSLSGDKQKTTTGENVDGATLEIPGVQRDLIKQVQAVGKPVVLVLVNGKPFTLAWEDQNIPAILETWYPGEEGGNATADILFGNRNPSGRLPITLPRSVGQLPLNYDYLPSGRNYNYYDMPFTPLYRFGHGLSYTTFKYSNLVITPRKDDPGFATVSVDIENTGDRDGDEVAQLYITDMLSSVITPVIQLKGIQRVSLKPGEKKTVTFELTPYQLSFLNADMERVIEPAQFRVHVGGVSPEPPDGSGQHKQKIGFKNPAQGISGQFEIAKKYQAEFHSTLNVPAKVQGGKPFSATVIITNSGNLLDVAEVKLYGDRLLGERRFEIGPGQSRTYTFNVALYQSGAQNLTAVVGKRAVSRTIQVSKTPAKLALQNARTSIGDDGVLHYQADAANIGSETYRKSFDLYVDGKVVARQKLELAPGAHQALQLAYAFPHAGEFRVKLGEADEQSMTVPGGVTLTLSAPLLYLSFDATNLAGVKNEINGGLLPVQGTPRFVAGKNGSAFETDSKDVFIKAGGVDLYRKAFTLAAWVNIESLEDRQAMFFGGQAPMGADVDTTGTGLAAGVFQGNPLLSFWDRDVKGKTKISTGQWMHLAYTYDPDNEKGSIYINGKLDTTAAQKTYTGPLDIIGGSIRFRHGKYAMDDVLVAQNCLDAKTVAALAGHGVESLQRGEIVTDWRALSSAAGRMETWADVPAGAEINITVETGDGKGTVLGSKSIKVKSGEQNVSLAGLKTGEKVRLRIQLTAMKWGSLPTLQTVSLPTAEGAIRWSTISEWAKGSLNGGLKIGK